MVGSLTGAVSSQRVTEECEGTLSAVGNRAVSAKAQGCLAPRCRLITSWGCSRSQGYGCSPFKVVRELGLERRETVRSLSAVGARDLRGVALSTRGPERTHLWWTGCRASRI